MSIYLSQALYSPSTGIVDSHALMLAIQGDAEAHGAVVAVSTTVESGVYDDKSKRFVVCATQDGEHHELECDYFVNATGIFAPLLLDKFVQKDASVGGSVAINSADRESERQRRIQAAGSSGVDLPTLPELFAKGTYFKLRESVRPFR